MGENLKENCIIQFECLSQFQTDQTLSPFSSTYTKPPSTQKLHAAQFIATIRIID